MSADSLDNSGKCALFLRLLLLRGLVASGLVVQCFRPWAEATCKLVSNNFLLTDVRVRPDQIPVEIGQATGATAGLPCLLGPTTAPCSV